MTLDMLGTGRAATVKKINNQSTERRRLLDLGILPGTRIENVMPSPLGDPIAYRVRSSVIALRREQARLIEIEE
ncbi:MAG TPA: FeoA family protein [Pyrinomonadaceae bacterium]|nr:FeoA family protein [Pyrinomonadaceae bacterium]